MNNPPRKRSSTCSNNVEINPEVNKAIPNKRKKRHKTQSINLIPYKSKNRLCLKCKTSKNDPLVVYKTKVDKNQDDKRREDKVSKEQSISHLSHLNIWYDCVFKCHDEFNKNDSQFNNVLTYKEKTEFKRTNDLSKTLIKYG